jgi:hypothetical protein
MIEKINSLPYSKTCFIARSMLGKKGKTSKHDIITFSAVLRSKPTVLNSLYWNGCVCLYPLLAGLSMTCWHEINYFPYISGYVCCHCADGQSIDSEAYRFFT